MLYYAHSYQMSTLAFVILDLFPNWPNLLPITKLQMIEHIGGQLAGNFSVAMNAIYSN